MAAHGGKHLLVDRVLHRTAQVTGDQHGDDQTVDGNDTRHDDGDDRLHDQLGAHDGHGGDTGAGLGRAVGGSQS